jgi:hypothetical protein
MRFCTPTSRRPDYLGVSASILAGNQASKGEWGGASLPRVRGVVREPQSTGSQHEAGLGRTVPTKS